MNFLQNWAKLLFFLRSVIFDEVGDAGAEKDEVIGCLVKLIQRFFGPFVNLFDIASDLSEADQWKVKLFF
jgi:hypothetical protein